MLWYITECNLATVGHMSHLKSKNGTQEHERQIGIAQTAIDHIRTHTPKAGTHDEELAMFHNALRKHGSACTRVECVLGKYKGWVKNWVSGNEE